MRTVVALGGHLLAQEAGGLADVLAPLGLPLAITHGNGPQVGEELLRFPDQPVHEAVAKTQGEIGTRLALGLGAVVVVTHAVVDEDDPAFAEPTKPIGPVYDDFEARRLERGRGWRVRDLDGRGRRRLVASPDPTDVLELDAIQALLGDGTSVVACGGGGIPVVRRGGALVGVEAVIDKDRASALLAAAVGARRLVVLTDVDAVYRDFRSSSEHVLPSMTADEADALLPELPAGSMRPKVEACARFARETGGEALITSADRLADALTGETGTRVVP